MNTRKYPHSLCPMVSLVAVLILGLSFCAGLAQEPSAPDSAATSDVAPEPGKMDYAEEMLRNMTVELDSLTLIQSKVPGVENEELDLLRIQGARNLATIKELQPQFLKLLGDLEPTDPRVEDMRAGFHDFIIRKFNIYIGALEWWLAEIDQLRTIRTDVDLNLQAELEVRIGSARTRLDDLWDDLARILQVADAQGMDTEAEYLKFDRHLNARAEDLLGRMQVAAGIRDRMKDLIRTAQKAETAEDEINAMKTRLTYAEGRVHGVAASLENTANLLGQRGFETSEYRQAIIKNTRKISERVFDPKVMVGLVRDLLRTVGNWFRDTGPTILTKFLIIVATVLVMRVLFRFLWWLMRLVRVIKLTRLMLQLGQSLLNPIATMVGLFVGLWLVGANPTTLLTGAGVAGVIIGFALQDSLSNLAAGFFILATRPFDIDDVIMTGGVVGTVKAMWIANTTVVTFDGRRLLIPNRKIWADVIENRSVEPNRRVDVSVRVGFGEDIDRAITILHELVAAEERLLAQPEPSIFVAKWAESWVDIAFRPWARNEYWWAMLTDLPRQVAIRFEAEGIEIPYPRLAMTEGPRPAEDRPDKAK